MQYSTHTHLNIGPIHIKRQEALRWMVKLVILAEEKYKLFRMKGVLYLPIKFVVINDNFRFHQKKKSRCLIVCR